VAQIGREEGVSRQTISKQLASTNAWQIVVALTNREIGRVSMLFSQVLQAIGEGLEARRVQVQDGALVDLRAGPLRAPRRSFPPPAGPYCRAAGCEGSRTEETTHSRRDLTR